MLENNSFVFSGASFSTDKEKKEGMLNGTVAAGCETFSLYSSKTC
jgi:hypothetical protein